MFGKKRKQPSLFRRLVYFVLLVSGGGAGIGGYALKDHPTVQALLALVTGDSDKDSPGGVEKTLVGDVVGVLKKGPDFSRAGVYQVTISKVELAQGMFKPGRTVDIQAKVIGRDSRGQDTVIWDSRNFGERLAVVGKDSLTASWPNRPFQVEWRPGEVVFLEVYDKRLSLFTVPKRFTLSSSNGEADFPLKTGDFPLEAQQRQDPPLDPRLTHIVLNSQKVGDLQSSPRDTGQAAADSDRPIVIK
jgi:hypothetical protein